MELAKKKVLILGLGVTGEAAAIFCKNRGAFVTVTDIADETSLNFCDVFKHHTDIKKEIGFHNIKSFEHADIIIISPGVPHNIVPVLAARKKGVKIISEIELAYQFITSPIVAITGTNGKTTVTTLTGEMLKCSGKKVFVGGNIGYPLIEHVNKGDKVDIVVAEVSSFQLDTIVSFKPDTGVLLNISEDHLDRYSNYMDYAASKSRIFENQSKNDTAVLNSADSLVQEFSKSINSKKLFFNAKDEEKGVYIRNNNCLTFKYMFSKSKNVCVNLENINLIGKHNIENAAASSLAALASGGSIDGILLVLQNFKGLKHRLQYVDTIDDIDYFNDSKATNIGSVTRALEFFTKPVVLIMGGIDKGGDYRQLKPIIRKHVKKIIVIGEAKKRITSNLKSSTEIFKASSLEEAVFFAHKSAAAGDVVLLSPACSSFDMFKNYSHRGEVFCKSVTKIKNKKI
mmetsp:Transcript_3761/g.2231  ORF Transcript_3761/g.2231 Transcript_3761/m.2231 type:complete len:456 (+) Transcript_3761:3700-5067(+)